MTPTGGCEAAAVDAQRDWRARFRAEPAPAWSECRVLDVTLTGAVLELGDDGAFTAAAVGAQCLLQIDSIADDDVGIVMQAVVCDMREDDDGRPVLDVEFSARREERLLLHLLVRLHALV